jgi:UrcA family protein
MLKFQIAVATLLVCAAVPALAESTPIVVEGDAPSMSVSYAGLDLTSPVGRQILEGRVARAASQLCTESGRKTVERASWEHRCISTALSGARADIGRLLKDSSVRIASGSTILVAAK